MLIKLLIVLCLIGIVISLGSGLFFMVREERDSKRMVRALTVRVALSVTLFVLLFLAWFLGLIQPNAAPAG
jgi:cytochrome bd-type quinol oxidase subunit 2